MTARDGCGCRYLPKCQHLWGQCVESPMFAALVHETVQRQGWGPSFAMERLDIPRLWRAPWRQDGDVCCGGGGNVGHEWNCRVLQRWAGPSGGRGHG